jgi:micrococcal nuclease
MSLSRPRLVLLVLGLVVLAVVVGRGLHELALGLHVLGGAGVDQVGGDSAADPAPDGGADGVTGPGRPLPPPEPPQGVPDPAQRAVVDRVVDGDTIRVRVDGAGAVPPTTSTRVRLLNIDAPELDHPTRGEDCGAARAAELLERLVPPGAVVWLVSDVEDRDQYDRPLRAVFADDGTFVNAEMVRRGWAEVVLFEPNDRFHEALLTFASEARQEGRGVWAACEGFG